METGRFRGGNRIQGWKRVGFRGGNGIQGWKRVGLGWKWDPGVETGRFRGGNGSRGGNG